MKRIFLIFILMILSAASSSACTTVIVSAKASASGKPLLWKQRDTSAEFNYLDFFEESEEGMSFTGVVNTADKARESVWSGVNESGFAIMNSQSYGLSPINQPERELEGIVMKKALRICRTVDDFEKYLASLPRPNGLEANYGVIDARGGAAYFEVHDLGYRRYDVDTYLIRTNYSISGRKGEGKGYDRYDEAERLMQEHDGGFTPEWILETLGRNKLIARDKTVSSVVFEGIGEGDAPNSTVIWCAPGYTPCCYAIPVWCAARNLIPETLRKASGQGSEMNELANRLLKSGTDIREEVRKAEDIEFNEGRKLDAIFRKEGIKESAVVEFNKAADIRFRIFKKSLSPASR